MPLPNTQLAQFHSGLAEHERRIAQLQEGIKLAREELEFHRLLLRFAQNEQTIATLHELHDQPDSVAELQVDPMQYLREKRVPLPDGVTVAATDKGARATLRTESWQMVIGWDHEVGFFAEPPKGPAACLSTRFMSSVEPELSGTN